MALPPPDFESMFRPGMRYGWPNRDPVGIFVVDVGAVNLASGRLVVRDNDWSVQDSGRDAEAFTEEIPPGRYRVVLSLVDFDEWVRGAAAKVVIRDEPAVSWEMALCPGQDPSKLGEEEFFGFGVDSGQGCFLDVTALPLLRRFQDDTRAEWEGIRKDVMRDGWAEVTDAESGLNVILFDCGMGDGAYPTWIGRSTGGEAVCFISDLELLSHSLGPIGDL
ncbi:DUF4241 domain-containing protein [Microtetraspora malaysiensis]|uniref:DUF4241 domain-containing protein n=1 Tax=Microtetraspora malaysiensis TaxID=161358 RepID=UPI00082A528A|nr:DUF4241 domain-containing protein [Microtetraspora malaysiensis]